MALSPTSRKAREIFEDAIERDTSDARAAFIAQACGGDAGLLHRVKALLKANDDAESMLPNEPQPLAFSSATGEQPGAYIGRYKLLEKIGEGGCGVVYMAEQEEPIRRRVALKLIKPGMDSKSVIARFESERQALAMMDHPNIAKVHDGGVTDTGRPFFVMELVRGIRITNYCQNHALTTRERLDLFTAVCSAVQHAHQKGIIHRDLKPSNILVTELDGRPVPKVIDFGIAKATDQKLTDKTLFTQFAQFVGTPAYMSPEQAALSGADIDTRSDIYSLGVLLYELLTGTTPFDAEELLASGLEAMCRTIRDTDPPKPSTRLTQSLAAWNGKPPAKSETEYQKSDIASDLDWIVMKALEKDRARRYETASSMAMDVQRHLNHEPVTARPASTVYRFRKMVRRNKVVVIAAAAVLATLVAGLGVSTWMFFKEKHAGDMERQARERAVDAEQEQSRLRLLAETQENKATTEAIKSRQVARFLKDMLHGVGPSVALGDDTKMLRTILDETAESAGRKLKEQPEVEAELRNIIGNVYEAVGEYGKAREMLEGALAITKMLRGNEHQEIAALLNDLAVVLHQQGQLEDAEAMIREALAMERKLLGNDADVSTQLNNLATTLTSRGRLEEAETVHREALAMTRKFVGNEHGDVATSLSNLGVVLDMLGKNGEAEAMLREALDLQRKLRGNNDPNVAATLNNLAEVLRKQDKLEESETLFRETLTLQRNLLGNAHLNVASALNGLGLVLLSQGKANQAEPLLREGVEIERKARKTAHPQTATLVGNLGRVMEGLHKYDEAESHYRDALSICRQLSTEHPDEVNWRNRLHNFLKNQGRLAEMETFDREIIAIQRKRYGDEHPGVAAALTNLGNALVDQKKIEESEPVFHEALAIRRKLSGDDSNLAWAVYNLAMTLNSLGRSADAELLAQEAANLTIRLLSDDKGDNKSKRDALNRIVYLYQVIGEPDKAAAWQQKLADFDTAEVKPVAEMNATQLKPDSK